MLSYEYFSNFIPLKHPISHLLCYSIYKDFLLTMVMASGPLFSIRDVLFDVNGAVILKVNLLVTA